MITVLLVAGIAGCGGGGGWSPTSSDNKTELTNPGTPTPSPDPGDTSAPEVNSTTPGHGEDNVAPNSDIVVTFDKNMDAQTITSATFFLKKSVSEPDVPATVTYSESSRTAVLRPSSPLLPDTNYTATVDRSVTDLAGKSLVGDYPWEFTTGVGTDETAPTVLNTFPSAAQPDVYSNTSIVATMSEAIAPGTITNQNFTLHITGDPEPVAGSVTNFGTNLIFHPEADLAESSNYTATLTTGIKDLAGNSLATENSWSFTTGINFDMQTPKIVSISPYEGQPDVLLDAVFIVTFNEAIMPFEYGLLDGRPVTVTSNEDYTVVTLTPDSLFAESTYTASIRVSDMAGNLMDSAYIWQFSTINP